MIFILGPTADSDNPCFLNLVFFWSWWYSFHERNTWPLTGLFLFFHTLFTSADKRRLPLCPVIGYGCAWIGHFFVEQNKPASFKYPLYLCSSSPGSWFFFYMFLLFLWLLNSHQLYNNYIYIYIYIIGNLLSSQAYPKVGGNYCTYVLVLLVRAHRGHN